jgi:hypothetical protein
MDEAPVAVPPRTRLIMGDQRSRTCLYIRQWLGLQTTSHRGASCTVAEVRRVAVNFLPRVGTPLR